MLLFFSVCPQCGQTLGCLVAIRRWDFVRLGPSAPWPVPPDFQSRPQHLAIWSPRHPSWAYTVSSQPCHPGLQGGLAQHGWVLHKCLLNEGPVTLCDPGSGRDAVPMSRWVPRRLWGLPETPTPPPAVSPYLHQSPSGLPTGVLRPGLPQGTSAAGEASVQSLRRTLPPRHRSAGGQQMRNSQTHRHGPRPQGSEHDRN